MAGVNVKMGVSGVNEFKRSMNESKEAVRTLNEALKANEAQLKLTGDEEAYAERQASTLKAMIEAQKQVFDNATKALQEMDRQGVDPASASFQKMQQQALRAQTDLNKMQLELRNVESGATDAKVDTESMNSEMKKIGDGVNWQNVTEGLSSVISKLESGARAAINFGKRIMRYVSSSAEWADELKTTSQQTGYSVEELQRMEIVADTVDTSVDAIITAQNRMKKAASTSGGKNAIEELLGINLNGQSPDDLFWEIGDALLHMENAYDQEQAAQSVFGRSWRDLVPLFLTGRDAYEQMLEEADQFILSEESVNKLGEVNDALDMAENRLEQIKNQFIADNADKILELLEWFVNNYETVVNGLIAIGAALGAMKLGSFVLDLQKTIKGFRELGLFGGNNTPTVTPTTTPTTTPSGDGSGGVAGGFDAGKILNTLALVAAAGTMYEATVKPLIELSKNFKEQTAGMSLDDQQIYALMHDLNLTEEQAREMHREATFGTSGGTSFGEHGQTGWNGMATGFVDKSERMSAVAEQMVEATYKASANSLTSNDIANFNGLPGQIARAVENANIRIYIDGELAGASVAPYVNTAMGGMIKGYTK